MNAEQFIAKLMGYYKGSYSPERIEQLKRFSRGISEKALEDVYNSIIENREKDGAIAVVDLKKACQEQGAAFTETKYVPTEDWTCEACGNEFKYHPCPSDDDKIDKGIFDVCPNCGYQVAWSITADAYKKIGYKIEWDERLKAECPANHGRNVSIHKVKKGPLEYETGGIYWSRALAERERRDESRRNAESAISMIDRAKRFEPTPMAQHDPGRKPEPVAASHHDIPDDLW